MTSILVTGGTGSFGRAFVESLLRDSDYSRICIYSRSEFAQAEMRRLLDDKDNRLRFFIGDVRDLSRLRRAMTGVQDVVHAAALKRIEVGHYNPDEMVKTNVLGAMNLIEAAADAGVERVVALSTDKAWQPISPYGQTKALAESLFLAANSYHKPGPEYIVVRYGNIFGSRGSVVPFWRTLLKSGTKTLPVTDLGCTRFYMRQSEAVDLVNHALEMQFPATPLIIPRDLPAYRLGDLVEALRQEETTGFDVKITGLPAWEKKHEGMMDGVTSDVARRMDIYELRLALGEIHDSMANRP